MDTTASRKGDAKWLFSPVRVTPSTPYRYVDWYRSSGPTEVMVEYTLSGGGSSQVWLGALDPSAGWKEYTNTITPPTNAVAMTVWHSLTGVGYLETDDYSVSPDLGRGFSRALVTLTFDDGWANHATVAMPALRRYGYHGTFYIISGVLNTGHYLSSSQVVQLRNAGNEIGSHTVTHPHMLQISSAQQDTELKRSQADLEALIGAPVPDFATPYGDYDDALVNKIMPLYSSHRTVQSGFNTKDDTDFYRLKVQNVDNTTTRADVDGWLATAKAQGSWLILVYHELTSSPGRYDTTPALFDAELQAVRASGLTVKTLDDAMAEVAPQL